MLNKMLLLSAARGSGTATIGQAGQISFGVSPYPGADSDLAAMQLTPMDGCFDPASENYGNYQHANGSIMCCIPAFAYRLGNAAAPSYSRDGADAVEIKDATEFAGFEHDKAYTDGSANLGDGWILHRAFVDGGKMKNCFFFDKYLCSRSGSTNVAVSVKNADWIMLYSGSQAYTSKTMGFDGCIYDGLTLSNARGDYYCLQTVFMWSALALLSLAHGQAAASADACAWFDSSYQTNFPKGATNSGGTDYNDSTVKYTIHAYGNTFAKTGSGTPFNKLTHNGQACGVADLAGMCNQVCLGAGPSYNYGEYGLLKPSLSAHSITKANRNNSAHYDLITDSWNRSDGIYAWGKGALYTESSGAKWSACGVITKINATAAPVFGKDEFRAYQNGSWDRCMFCGLGNSWGQGTGVFCRALFGFLNIGNFDSWHDSYLYFGFRSAGYAP